MGWSTKWEDVPVSEEDKINDIGGDPLTEKEMLEGLKPDWSAYPNSPEFIKKCNEDFDKEFKIKNIFGTGISTDKENPNAILTFECDNCHAEFNCNTIKFGVLCDQAAIAGWRIIWLDHGYKSYCGQCKGKARE